MRPERTPAVRDLRWPWWLLGAGTLLAGAFARIWQLRSQMLIDDEWHAVRKLTEAGMEDIADHFGVADYSIPLTLYDRWLYEHNQLSEWAMHLPLLIAGLALLVIAPLLLRRTLELPVRVTWLGLLAVSPLLIYFSRTARPYALLALCGVLAFLALRNWVARGGRAPVWAGLYVLATCLAAWAHLLSLVFTLWPLACAALIAIAGCLDPRQREQAARVLRGSLLLGALIGGLLLIALAPPLINDWAALAGKAGANSVSGASLYRTLLMQFGITDALSLSVVLILLALGALRLWRSERFLVLSVLSAAIVGMGVIALTQPAWVQHPLVFARYATPILPWLLLLVAAGLVDTFERLRKPWLTMPLVLIALIALLARGPLPTWFYWPNQFMGHALFQFDYDPAHNPYVSQLELGPISPFYTDLAKRPAGSVTLIETPARAHSNYMPDPWLQQIHHQNVKFALASPICGVGAWDEYPYTASGTRFKRMGRLEDILKGANWGADYLVLRMHPWTLPAGKAFPWPAPWPDMAACAVKVEAKLGAPIYRDESVVVFALRGAS